MIIIVHNIKSIIVLYNNNNSSFIISLFDFQVSVEEENPEGSETSLPFHPLFFEDSSIKMTILCMLTNSYSIIIFIHEKKFWKKAMLEVIISHRPYKH